MSFVRKCHSCDGEGRTDGNNDVSERAPWSFWENLPPGADIAVRSSRRRRSVNARTGHGHGKEANGGTGMTAAKTMAEVLARRNFEAEYDDLQWDELTEPVKAGWRKDAQDSLDFLATAGFGLVVDAKAEALDEVEEVIDSELQDAEPSNYEEDNFDAGYIHGLTYAQVELRARAAALRGQG